ncbi:MAG: TIGR03013 family XrtA/PEP-CTERM system glycosyltransferase [Candidatus Rokuibacteriota bacterium]
MLRVFRHYVPTMLVAVVLSDIAIITAALLAPRSLGTWTGEGPLWPKTVVFAGIFVLVSYVADLYRLERPIAARELAARVLLASAVGTIMTAAAGFAVPGLRFGRLAFVQAVGLVAVGLLLSRLGWRHLRPTQRLRPRVLVLGVGPAARTIVHLQSSGSQPFAVIGFLDDAPDAPEALPAGAELLGKSKDLLNLVDELQPDLVLVALADMRSALPTTDLLECRLRGIRVEDWPTFYERQTGKVMVTNLRPSWLIFSDGFVKTDFTQALKRAVDLILAAAGVVVTLPLMAVIAGAIKLDSRGAVFFRQERVGQHGRIFVLNKFRSMADEAERSSGPVWACERDGRVTRVGYWLRRTRLDELPQFFNVLVGDMSFIGPRPERPEFVRTLQRQIPFYMERHSVKPGITGWAQVRHQYAASVEDSLEKLQYDLYYIKNLSLLLDLLILLSTIQVVLFAKGSR